MFQLVRQNNGIFYPADKYGDELCVGVCKFHRGLNFWNVMHMFRALVFALFLLVIEALVAK